MRTGDLGFFNNDELFICGRLKDLVIVGGKNIYPNDIETTAEKAHDLLRRGCSACFSIEGFLFIVEFIINLGTGTEKVCYVAEIKREPTNVEATEVIRSILDAVSTSNEVTLSHIVLIKERAILKTTSVCVVQ
jgi:acyl-CoA synthetase (AMP-forming)/AMP-acid ligase II